MGFGLMLAMGTLIVPFQGRMTATAQEQDPNRGENHLIWSLPEAKETYIDLPIVPGEILVGFHSDRIMAASTMGELGLQVVEKLDLRASDELYGQRMKVAVGQEWATIDALARDPAVAFAEPNWIVRAAGDGEIRAATEIPFPVNDPLYESHQWYLQRMQTSRAWGLTTGGNALIPAPSTIQVAVIDSGIDAAHPEFTGRLLVGKNYVTPGTTPIDDCGHGTHVAGLIGAAVNNGSGSAGAAINVEIDPRKVLQANCGGSISNVAKAVEDATDAGADVINMSLEAPFDSPTLKNATKYAAQKGVLLIASAGNGATTVQWPAAYSDVMAVAATTYNDGTPFYSNFGSQIEIAAPGGDSFEGIYSTWSQNAALACSPSSGDYRIIDGGSYCYAIGTSMSAALVSGAAALLWGAQPDLSAQQVRSILRETATPTGAPVADVGSGRVDLHRALRRVVPSDLNINEAQIDFLLPQPTDPFTTTLTLQNPSLEAMTWRISVDPDLEWLQVPDAPDGSGDGVVAYGAPVHLPLIISPTNELTQSFGTTLELVGVRQDESEVKRTVDVQLIVGSGEEYRLLVPAFLATKSTPPAQTANFSWESPDDPDNRIILGLSNSSRVWITLPFTFPIRDRDYINARLYSDGFLSFAESESSISLPPSCLPEIIWPHDAIYGWWTDLDPGAAGARVSLFPVETDRYVVEFENVALVGSAADAVVSFQMVLYDDGQIDLNYLNVPPNIGVVPFTTIGVEALDGRMHNQVYCADTLQELGSLPEAEQSFVIKAEDIY